MPFLASVGLLTLNALFYLALALMLSTWFQVRSGVTGSALAVLFGGSVLTGFLPWTLKVTPWKMVDFGVAWMIQGTLPPGLGQIVAITVGWMFLFVIVALFRFEREEL